MPNLKDNVELLKNYRQELLEQQQILHELDQSDFCSSSEPPPPSPEIEQIARLADDFGFEGSLFRNYSPFNFNGDYQMWGRWTSKNIKERIDTIPKIIAAIEKPPDRSIIPESVELLTVPQVARILNCGESVVRERDKKGLLPLPVRIGGTVQWRKQELWQWLGAECPSRQKWEQIKQGKEL